MAKTTVPQELSSTPSITDDGTNVGIGTASPDGTLHVHTATAGTLTPNAAADDLVIENNTNAGITIVSPDASYSGIIFASPTDPTGSIIEYNYSGATFDIGTAVTNGILRFRSGNYAEAMRIDSSGNVGIGTTPAANVRLDIRSNAAATLGDFRNASATGYGLYIAAGDTDSQYVFRAADYQNNALFTITGAGNVGIGTSTPADMLHVTGNARIIGAYSSTTGFAANVFVQSTGKLFRSTSSARYKNSIQNATHGLTELLSLRPVTYKGNEDGDTVFGGLIAEEVHEAGLTEFVQYNEEGQPDALAYGNMVSLCVKAIQEQQAQIETLQAEVAALKGE